MESDEQREQGECGGTVTGCSVVVCWRCGVEMPSQGEAQRVGEMRVEDERRCGSKALDQYIDSLRASNSIQDKSIIAKREG